MKISPFRLSQIDEVLDIWLEASIKAHYFIDTTFWQSQKESMRTIYLPNSRNFVALDHGIILGFYSLYEENLAAIMEEGRG